MDEPLISCIVPVYNCERYVGEALKSIIKQSYRTFEIIVADDGSTDETARVIGQYGKQIRYLRQMNAGPAAARNLGLNAARGEFVAFLDADDLWHPEKLQRQAAWLRDRPKVDLCFTWFQNFWIPELAQEKERYEELPLSQPQSAWSTSTLLARRSVFTKFGFFVDDGSLTFGSESMIWFLHAADGGAVIDVLPDVLMYRRLHAANVSRRKPVETFLPILKEWRDHQRRRDNR